MKNKTSNNAEMNDLKLLGKIQRVSAPKGLYSTILKKSEDRIKNNISMNWVRSTAAFIFILIALETYAIISNLNNAITNFNTIESLIYIDKNVLYND